MFILVSCRYFEINNEGFFKAIGRDPLGTYLALCGDANPYRALAYNKQTKRTLATPVERSKIQSSEHIVVYIQIIQFNSPM